MQEKRFSLSTKTTLKENEAGRPGQDQAYGIAWKEKKGDSHTLTTD